MNQDNKVVLFQEKQIRRVWHDEQWYFAVVDVLEVLTESKNPSVYWRVLKKRLLDEGANETVTNCNAFKMPAVDGKMRSTDCLHTEGLLRLIMSVPSPKAEPLKLWLAQVGKERIEETVNPELAFDHAREIYKAKGYPDDWIGYREKSIIARKQLTDEWKARGVKEGQEYSILTATIAKGTFGLTPTEHSQLKGLEKENLRDHMTLIELIFTALSEESTRLIAENDDAKGFNENHEAAVKGGNYAGNARLRLEEQIQKPVVSKENFLGLSAKKSNKEIDASK